MGLLTSLGPKAASYSGDMDWLFWLIPIIVGAWFLAAEFMFVWLIFRFRAKDGVPSQYITGKEKHLGQDLRPYCLAFRPDGRRMTKRDWESALRSLSAGTTYALSRRASAWTPARCGRVRTRATMMEFTFRVESDYLEESSFP